MPSLHCHFPPDEEEKKLEQEEVIDLGEEVAAPNENEAVEMHENADVARNDEEENDSTDNAIYDIDDTWSLVPPIFNDQNIQKIIPIVSSSDDDDNESEIGGFWTPPLTMSDDFEQMEISTSGRQADQQPERNTAQRSRARRPGVLIMRRGQPLSVQEWPRLSAFDHGLTFNGFDQNLEPEEIIGIWIDRPREILYYVKWKTLQEPKLIESSLLCEYRPQMIIDYFETVIYMNPQQH